MRDLTIKYNRQIINDKLLFFNCLLIAFMIVARDIVGISYSKYILLAACIMSMPFLTYSNFLCLLGFLFALTFGIPSTYVYLFAAVFLLIKKKSSLNSTAVLIFLFYFVLEIVLSLVYHSTNAITSYIGYFTRLIIFFILVKEKSFDIDYKKILKYFIFGILLLMIVVVVMYLKDNSFEDIFNGRVRIGEADLYLSQDSISDGMKMSTNTNNVAYFCLVGMAGSLALFNSEKKIMWVVVFLALFAMGSLTISKTFFFISAVCFLILMYIVFLKKIKLWKKLVVSALFLAIFYFVLTGGAFGALLNRFNKVDYVLEDVRSEIMKNYFINFWQSPSISFFGAGVFTHRQVLYPEQSTHCGLQQILVSYGLIGFVAFIVFCVNEIFSRYKDQKKDNKFDIILFVPLFTVIVFTQTIQFLNPVDLMLPFVIGMFVLNIKSSDGGKLNA